MNRHLPHLLVLAKGLLLAIGLSLFIASGLSAELAETIRMRFYNWPLLQAPVYWLVSLMGSLLLVFPFTLAEDHLLRAAEGDHEETPWEHWLRGFAGEIAVGTLVGGAIYAAMTYLPGIWWLALSGVWAAYHLLMPWLQSMALVNEDEEAPHERRPDLLADLKEPLAGAGVALTEVRLMDEDAEAVWMHPDMQFVQSGRATTLFIPRAWVHQWTLPEVLAVALHKAWLMAPPRRSQELGIHFLSAIVCLGGFAALYPAWQARFALDPINNPSTIPTFMLWALFSLSCLRTGACALSRRWMRMADDQVIEWMGGKDGLLAALERAHREIPAGVDAPRWAEILFFNAPPLRRRMDRLK